MMWSADHPRSRGVYVEQTDAVETDPWIIPARAGFTGLSETGVGPSGDHPRSRGVYRPRRGTSIPEDGSSPLARGLHVYT